MIERLRRWLRDPPPAVAFELSEEGIAAAWPGRPPRIAFQPLGPGVISVSPLRGNVLDADELAAKIRTLAGGRETRKRHDAALILPDASVRVVVLDFDSFPSAPPEQLALVRFRIRKGLPFDLDSAALSYFVQATAGKRVDVVVAAAPLEIVTRYEAPLRVCGLLPGLVTTSTLAALELVREEGAAVLMKLSGRFLTISVLEGSALKLLRWIELSEASPREILEPLYPTLAYAEDELGARAGKVLLCGFGAMTEGLRAELQRELGMACEPLRSRWGAVESTNAGLLGWLESLEEARAAA
ncbi:MAG: type IV pilus biogenesis protein PilM [Bryobacteraceae bacterium]